MALSGDLEGVAVCLLLPWFTALMRWSGSPMLVTGDCAVHILYNRPHPHPVLLGGNVWPKCFISHLNKHGRRPGGVWYHAGALRIRGGARRRLPRPRQRHRCQVLRVPEYKIQTVTHDAHPNDKLPGLTFYCRTSQVSSQACAQCNYY